MTELENKIAMSLSGCTFLPGSFDKRFVSQLYKWKDRDMTDKGRDLMIKLFHKYRRQIHDYSIISQQLPKVEK